MTGHDYEEETIFCGNHYINSYVTENELYPMFFIDFILLQQIHLKENH